MPVQWGKESAYAQESRKWEAQYTDYGPPGRPYVKRDYPMMLHLAGRGDTGPMTIVETVIVESEQQLTYPWSRGFRPTPQDALDFLAAQELEYAKLAAEREYEVKHKLSPAAVADVRAAEAESFGHVPVIAERPKKPRGRPFKKREPEQERA